MSKNRFKYYSTAKLKFIIDHWANQDEAGKDFQPFIEDIKVVYWERLERLDRKKQEEQELLYYGEQ